MSDINAHDFRLIENALDVRPLYEGAGKNGSKAGMEIELAFFDMASEELAPLNVAQNTALMQKAREALPGDWMRNEPTAETLEVGSIAAGVDDLRGVLDDANLKVKIAMQAANALGFKRSYFQELPDKTADELLSQIVDIERYHAFFDPPRADMRGFAEYFSVCKSNQFSVSYKNPQHLHANLQRLYCLSPVLFMLSENSAPFSQGAPFSGHQGMHYRRAGLKEGRGGVPPYIFSARSGEELIEAHIGHVFNNPLFVYYDAAGKIVRLPAGEWTSFKDLKEKGLNTASNYFFAQTVLWPDIKIAALKNAAGEVDGHRFEVRMFGVGAHQHQWGFLLTCALAFDEDFARGVDELLRRYGFLGEDHLQSYDLLQHSYRKAREHGGNFLDIEYGGGVMCRFVRELSALARQSKMLQDFEAEMEAFHRICECGCTDSKVNSALFPTLEDVRNFQKTYDESLLLRHNACARDYLEPLIAADGGIECAKPCRAA